MSPRDFKPSSPRRKKASGSARPGSSVSFLSGLGLGLLVAFGVYLWAGRLAVNGSTPPATSDTRTRPAAPAPPQLPRPTFDFYKILPEMEVSMPDWAPAREPAPEPVAPPLPMEPATASTPPLPPPQESPGPAPAPASMPAPTPAPTDNTGLARGTYVLQVGSFQQFEDADRIKATLAMSGITANIQRVVINGQDVWFRVHVGPLSTEDEIRAMRMRLMENDVDFILLRIGETGTARR